MSEPYLLLVNGGRDFRDYAKLTEEIMKLHDNELMEREVSIVSGMAGGADRLAYNFCTEHQVKCHEMPADWSNLDVEGAVIKYNKWGQPYNVLAGHMRNTEMAAISHGLLSFWDGRSTGTKDMIDKMRTQNKQVRIIHY